MVPVWLSGSRCLLSVNEVLQIPILTTVVHPQSPFYGFAERMPKQNPYVPTWESTSAGISDEDWHYLSSEHAQAILQARHVAQVRWLDSGHLAIDWGVGRREGAFADEAGLELAAFDDANVLGFRLHEGCSNLVPGRYALLNTNNEVTQWLIRVDDASRQGGFGLRVDQVGRAISMLKWAIVFPSSENFDSFVEFVSKWPEVPGLPRELYPPPLRLDARMITLRGRPAPSS